MKLNITNFGHLHDRIQSAAIDIKPLMLFTGDGVAGAQEIVVSILNTICSPVHAPAANPSESFLDITTGDSHKALDYAAAFIDDPLFPDGPIDLMDNHGALTFGRMAPAMLSDKWTVHRHPYAGAPPQEQIDYAADLIERVNEGEKFIVMTHSGLILEKMWIREMAYEVDALKGHAQDRHSINPDDYSCHLFRAGRDGANVSIQGIDTEMGKDTKCKDLPEYVTDVQGRLYNDTITLWQQMDDRILELANEADRDKARSGRG